ncbi:BREX-2 system adenine-specific DNA-methyltransferase PglX [Candidatus Protofrankia californiensis]|uniref:BREX-2 system adenine-specific DNA-methyltransferase PglX n=1 Tax=Candidatus Protofrankia californiensis TaxID=1839754 RepID=UPI001041587E|nr:BREX-2 system adenine-specific DNA-methyltransferase PglX [Candidatus Protofrankia californiensis]
MIDRKALLGDAQRQVTALEKDLRRQVDELAEVGARLRAEYDRTFEVKRTAATWPAWLDERVTQAAAAWVLGTVFVRFCEDNGLLAEPYLAGPDDDRMALAEERHEDFYRRHPHETARGWLLAAFDAIAAVPAGAGLFDRRHNALYQIPVSHDVANALVAFWRRRGEDGAPAHDFTDPDWDTRFLGDLYQDLSDGVRKKYALLQTPEFVEEFILDLTLTPAIDEFGQDADELKHFKLIDPTCGSGHFLLGAFRRLLAKWEKKAPSRDVHERVRLALDAVHGVDINPYAVAVARFRLVVTALRAAGIPTFTAAAGYIFPLHVAVGDSLRQYEQRLLIDDNRESDSSAITLPAFAYDTEDVHEHPKILESGRYHVVVGNPPYITVRDKEDNRHYRERFSACAGTFALSVPFAQHFARLAKRGDAEGRGSGYFGQITANSFMKREFGRKLVTEFFALWVELTHVIDTSGAYIPGHGTPTVILAGRNNNQKRSGTVRAVLGVRGEPAAPDVAGDGLVWRAIVEQVHKAGSESEWVSVVDRPRSYFSKFPWSLGGGGAADLVKTLENGARKMSSTVSAPIGRAIRAGADEAFVRPARMMRRWPEVDAFLKQLLVGEVVRDWDATPEEIIWYPYVAGVESILTTVLWSWRHQLEERRTFKGKMADAGLSWWEYMQHTASAYTSPLSISFGEVATHNHFVLDRGGKVFKQTAPVVKLPENAGEDQYLQLLGVLNSSTACFWLKQVCYPKGGDPVGQHGARVSAEPWSDRYAFNGSNLERFPLPAEYPLELARELDRLAQRLTAVSPVDVAVEGTPTRERLDAARAEWEPTRAQMIALQEELDWQAYRQYGLLDDELTLPVEKVPELKLGERAFEIVLAWRIKDGEETSEWFTRHDSTPITELPAHWPAEYYKLVEKRIALIKSNRYIALIERPEYKRRWATEGWNKLQDTALRDWLLDCCEARELWFHEIDGMEQPRLRSTAELADELATDRDFVTVAGVYRPGKDLGTVVAELVADEHVPYLAAMRYTETGLTKRASWEYVWDQQRAEDAETDEERKRAIRDAIPLPEKYAPKDLRKTSYWRARGKLDVPKERFISYPHASRDNDLHLLLGWAGWDHREQAQALATLVVEREEGDGWPVERLVPLLAGLREVLPWVRQWHDEVDPAYDGSPADVYADFLAERAGRLHLTDETLTSWRPPTTARGRRKKAGAA